MMERDKRDNLTEDGRTYYGYAVELTEKVCGLLNIVCRIRVVADGNYGSQQKDGSWDGMIGELTRRVSDSELEYNYYYAESEAAAWSAVCHPPWRIQSGKWLA